MKQLKYFLIILAILGQLTSCKKSFLEVSNGSTIYREDYVTDLKTLQQYLNGLYTLVATEQYRNMHVIYPELVSDNLKPRTQSAGLVPAYSWLQRADESNTLVQNVNGLSYSFYKTISVANYVLEKADAFKSEDEAKADAMKGQAFAIRALAHFWLVNIYAQPYNFSANGAHPGIVYRTTSDWTKPMDNRSTVAEVYTKMIDDLNNALNLVPASITSKMLVNRNFVKALLSRTYLFKEDFEAAKNLAVEVCNEVPLMTTDYPQKLFTPEETETLFQLPPRTSSYSTAFAGMYFNVSSPRFLATSDIRTLLREDLNDKRSAWTTNVSGVWRVTKFPQNVDADVAGAGSYYQSVMRSSEMFLTAAECFAKLNDEANAIVYLDQIRQRANDAALPTTATGPALLDSIYKERRKELCFESLRLFDLQRWKKSIERSDPALGAPATLTYPNDKAIAPIPGLDVKVSGIQQNPSY